MAQRTVEERIEVLEREVRDLTRRIPEQNGAKSWKRLVGVYRDDLAFDEAERLGKEWRDSFRPRDDEVAPL